MITLVYKNLCYLTIFIILQTYPVHTFPHLCFSKCYSLYTFTIKQLKAGYKGIYLLVAEVSYIICVLVHHSWKNCT